MNQREMIRLLSAAIFILKLAFNLREKILNSELQPKIVDIILLLISSATIA